MASPAPALATLKMQLHNQHPSMALGSLGIMADALHIAGGTSDHILGNAIDIPATLIVTEMTALVHFLLEDPRCHYCIYRSVFYHRGKAPTKYTGSSPHNNHIHMSINPPMRADVKPWKIKAAPKAYDAAYFWVDADLSAAKKAAFVDFCELNNLKLIVRAGEVGRTLLSVHVGERKRGAVIAELTKHLAIGVVTRKTRGGGSVAPDNTVRRLNSPTATVL